MRTGAQGALGASVSGEQEDILESRGLLADYTVNLASRFTS